MKVRFYLYALLTASLPLVLAMFVTGEVALRVDKGLDDRLDAAREGVKARLEADFARRRELLVRLSALADVSQGVKDAAAAGTAPSGELAARVRKAVTELYPKEVPELVAVVTAQGGQLVVSDAEPVAVAVADLAGASAALGGQFANVVALYEGRLVRFSAVPVGVGDGAIVLGDRLGEHTVARLRASAGAHVSFAVGDKVVLSTLPAAQQDEVAPAIAKPGQMVVSGALAAGVPGLAFLDGKLPLLVRGGAYRSFAQSVDGGVLAVVTIGVENELGWLGRAQLFAALFSLFVLFAAALWVPVLTGPVLRQGRSIEAHLARLRAERGAKLGTKGFSPPFAGIAAELDRLAAELSGQGGARGGEATPRPPSDKTSEKPSTVVKPGELDAWVPPPAQSPIDPEGGEGTPSAFPFGDDPTARAAQLGLSKPGGIGPLDPPEPPPSRSKGPSKPEPLDPPEPPPSRSKGPGKAEPLDPPMPGGEFDMSSTQTFVKPIIPPPKRDAGRSSLSGDAGAPGTDGGPIQLPSGSKKVDPITAAFGAAPEAPAGDKTRKTAVPDDLIARSRELEQELMDSPEDPDEAHFREVFAEFQETRKKCGEPPDGLTYDKFVGRLKKNREQLVAKFNCRTVRFQVYVKDGKAAIKAAPVK